MESHSARAIRSISVLIPTRNGEGTLDRVLAALAAQECWPPWNCLVVDSRSTDGAIDILACWQPRFPVPLLIREIHPMSFDHGDTRNLPAAESDGDFLVFLTQDVIPVATDWLATLLSNFDRLLLLCAMAMSKNTKEQLVGLRSDLEERNTRIEGLRQVITHREMAITRLHHAIRVHEQQLSERGQQITHLHLKVDARDRQLESLG